MALDPRVARFGASVVRVAAASTISVTDPRVEHGIAEIDEEVYQHVDA